MSIFFGQLYYCATKPFQCQTEDKQLNDEETEIVSADLLHTAISSSIEQYTKTSATSSVGKC